MGFNNPVSCNHRIKFNVVMSIPNLLALILLAPVVFTKTQELKNQFKA